MILAWMLFHYLKFFSWSLLFFSACILFVTECANNVARTVVESGIDLPCEFSPPERVISYPIKKSRFGVLKTCKSVSFSSFSFNRSDLHLSSSGIFGCNFHSILFCGFFPVCKPENLEALFFFFFFLHSCLVCQLWSFYIFFCFFYVSFSVSHFSFYIFFCLFYVSLSVSHFSFQLDLL